MGSRGVCHTYAQRLVRDQSPPHPQGSQGETPGSKARSWSPTEVAVFGSAEGLHTAMARPAPRAEASPPTGLFNARVTLVVVGAGSRTWQIERERSLQCGHTACGP